jgi:DNA-binding MarR family transcriptional regulator
MIDEELLRQIRRKVSVFNELSSEWERRRTEISSKEAEREEVLKTLSERKRELGLKGDFYEKVLLGDYSNVDSEDPSKELSELESSISTLESDMKDTEGNLANTLVSLPLPLNPTPQVQNGVYVYPMIDEAPLSESSMRFMAEFLDMNPPVSLSGSTFDSGGVTVPGRTEHEAMAHVVDFVRSLRMLANDRLGFYADTDQFVSRIRNSKRFHSVLDVLERRGPLTLAEISETTGVKKSTIKHTCKDLRRRSWRPAPILLDTETGKYSLTHVGGVLMKRVRFLDEDFESSVSTSGTDSKERLQDLETDTS